MLFNIEYISRLCIRYSRHRLAPKALYNEVSGLKDLESESSGTREPHYRGTWMLRGMHPAGPGTRTIVCSWVPQLRPSKLPPVRFLLHLAYLGLNEPNKRRALWGKYGGM